MGTLDCNVLPVRNRYAEAVFGHHLEIEAQGDELRGLRARGGMEIASAS
jgi:hypothetical protein